MTGTRKLAVLGLIVGLLSLGVYPVLFAATPLVPLLIAAVTALPSATRPFAKGALVAAVIGSVLLLVILTVTSSMGAGVERYGAE